MKTNKILTIVTIPSLLVGLVPCLVSCNQEKQEETDPTVWDTSKEYKPKYTPLPYMEDHSLDVIFEKYVEDVEKNKDIFSDDYLAFNYFMDSLTQSVSSKYKTVKCQVSNFVKSEIQGKLAARVSFNIEYEPKVNTEKKIKMELVNFPIALIDESWSFVWSLAGWYIRPWGTSATTLDIWDDELWNVKYYENETTIGDWSHQTTQALDKQKATYYIINYTWFRSNYLINNANK